MDATVIVAIITACASLFGSFLGCLVNSKLTGYRVEQLEKKFEIIPELEKRQINLESEIGSFTVNAEARKHMVEGLEEEVSVLKNQVGEINTKIALIENQIKMYHTHEG